MLKSGLAMGKSGDEMHPPYLVNWVDDPVDARITSDSLVLRIDEDDFIVFVGRILVDPVRVEHTEIGASTTNTLFSRGTEGSLILELVDTLVRGLAYADISHVQWSSRSLTIIP